MSSFAEQARRAGVTEQQFRQFLDDVQRLNAEYLPQIHQLESGITNGGGWFPSEEARQDAFINNRDAAIAPALDPYKQELDALIARYGVQMQYEDDGKTYTLNHGGLESTSNGEPGTFTTVNRSGAKVANALNDAVMFAANAAVNTAIGNPAGDFLGNGLLWSVVPQVDIGGLMDDSQPDDLNIAGGVNSDGTMQDVVGMEPGQSGPPDWLPDPDAITIPIPGLPFPIPGNLTIEDLWEMAKNAGRNTVEALENIFNGGESDPGGFPTEQDEPVDDDEEEGGTRVGNGMDRGSVLDGVGGSSGLPGVDPVIEDDPEDDRTLSTGQPGWYEDEAVVEDPVNETPGGWSGNGMIREDVIGEIGDGTGWINPGFNPPEIPPEDENQDTPGTEEGEETTGFDPSWLPGLLPFLVPENDPAPKPEYEMWDYIGVQDDSYGIQRPDYGTVQQRPNYDFSRQPSQPTQVGYNPQPRRDFLSVVEQERRRRQQRGLL